MPLCPWLLGSTLSRPPLPLSRMLILMESMQDALASLIGRSQQGKLLWDSRRLDDRVGWVFRY